MRRDEMRETLLSLLYTEYIERGKEIWFKARYLAADTGIPCKAIGHTCGELMEDGLMRRHGERRASAWGTLFNTFTYPPS